MTDPSAGHSDEVESTIAALIERSGPHAGRRHALGIGTWVIGRVDEADIVLDHADVSRRHATIVVDARHAEISDLGSKNGTRIADREVQRASLADGTQIHFGDLIVELEHPGARLDQVLARHLEVTVTRPIAPRPLAVPKRPSLLPPLFVAGVFGLLLLALFLFG